MLLPLRLVLFVMIMTALMRMMDTMAMVLIILMTVTMVAVAVMKKQIMMQRVMTTMTTKWQKQIQWQVVDREHNEDVGGGEIYTTYTVILVMPFV